MDVSDKSTHLWAHFHRNDPSRTGQIVFGISGTRDLPPTLHYNMCAREDIVKLMDMCEEILDDWPEDIQRSPKYGE